MDVMHVGHVGVRVLNTAVVVEVSVRFPRRLQAVVVVMMMLGHGRYYKQNARLCAIIGL